MRHSHTLSSFVLAACTVAAVPAGAQAQATLPLASDFTAAVAPLNHKPLPASGSVETAQSDWRSANAAVADFPRGHADILQWEATQAGRTSAPATAPPMPAGMHSHTPAPGPASQP